MFPQPLFRSPVQTSWSAVSAARLDTLDAPSWDASRAVWTAAFSDRLAELRPGEDEESLHALAAELWLDLGGHDPVIAAEMEHEATLGD